MTDDLALNDLVLERVTSAELPERVEDLVPAAFEDEDTLAAALAGTRSPMRTNTTAEKQGG